MQRKEPDDLNTNSSFLLLELIMILHVLKRVDMKCLSWRGSLLLPEGFLASLGPESRVSAFWKAKDAMCCCLASLSLVKSGGFLEQITK